MPPILSVGWTKNFRSLALTVPSLPGLLRPSGMAARDVAQALRTLASSARGVGANTGDPAARDAMLDCAADVMDKSANLIEETKRAIARPGDPDSQQRLAQVRRGGIALNIL